MEQSFRFVHARHDSAAGDPGMRISHSGGVDVVHDAAAIRQDLLLLLSTRPGERLMRPTYGCSLTHLVFAPNDETTAGLAIHYVRQAVTRWEPRIEVLRVQADNLHEGAEELLISLEYRIRASLIEDRIAHRVMLSDAGM